MKLAIFTDPHWSAKSSILRKRGIKYSLRLENEIKSMNWLAEKAANFNCSHIFCLGDFFDQSIVTAEEEAALGEVNWGPLPWNFIVGNHDASVQSLEFSTAHLLNLCPKGYVIDEPTSFVINNIRFLILPYIVDSERKAIIDYFNVNQNENYNKTIIFSHNDLKGIQYGGFESKVGFELQDIENNCDLFINGHLHNGEKISSKIINLGNFLGQNFSEDAFKYSHNLMILDTDTLNYEFIENPYAFNFYKLTNKNQIMDIKPNSIVTIKIKEKDLQEIKNLIEENPLIIESRILIEPENIIEETTQIELIKVDHLEQFKNYIFETLGTTNIIKEELMEISK